MFGLDLGAIAKGFGEGILSPIASIFNKKQDVSLEKYKVDGQLNVEAIRQDTEIIKARVDLAKAMKDEFFTRWSRGIILFCTSGWIGLTYWDSAFRNLIPEYTWRTLALPTNLEYIPYAVVAYLFVSAWKK